MVFISRKIDSADLSRCCDACLASRLINSEGRTIQANHFPVDINVSMNMESAIASVLPEVNGCAGCLRRCVPFQIILPVFVGPDCVGNGIGNLSFGAGVMNLRRIPSDIDGHIAGTISGA